jgi:hypothetical protein
LNLDPFDKQTSKRENGKKFVRRHHAATVNFLEALTTFLKRHIISPREIRDYAVSLEAFRFVMVAVGWW